MNKPNYQTCRVCKGDRFIKTPDDRNMLCPDCGGDGCKLHLAIQTTAEQWDKFFNAVVGRKIRWPK